MIRHFRPEIEARIQQYRQQSKEQQFRDIERHYRSNTPEHLQQVPFTLTGQDAPASGSPVNPKYSLAQ